MAVLVALMKGYNAAADSHQLFTKALAQMRR